MVTHWPARPFLGCATVSTSLPNSNLPESCRSKLSVWICRLVRLGHGRSRALQDRHVHDKRHQHGKRLHKGSILGPIRRKHTSSHQYWHRDQRDKGGDQEEHGRSMYDMIRKQALIQQLHREPPERNYQGLTDNHERKREDSSRYGSGTDTPKGLQRGPRTPYNTSTQGPKDTKRK